MQQMQMQMQIQLVATRFFLFETNPKTKFFFQIERPNFFSVLKLKFCRWSLLIAGVFYGMKRQSNLFDSNDQFFFALISRFFSLNHPSRYIGRT